MKEENNNGNQNENSTCPPIEIGLHQNSCKPLKNVETRGDNND